MIKLLFTATQLIVLFSVMGWLGGLIMVERWGWLGIWCVLMWPTLLRITLIETEVPE